MDDLTRTPLLDDRGRGLLRRMREHPDAPRWTYAVGDRLREDDLPLLDGLRVALRDAPTPGPSASVLAIAARALATVPRLRDVGPVDLVEDWSSLPTSDRAALAARPEAFVPADADLTRLVVYRTAGATGHPVSVPHHPVAVAMYLPLVEAALARRGVPWQVEAEGVAAVLVSAQLRTYTYATVLSGWGGAGFGKVNLRPTDWPRAGACARWLADMAPPLVNGEPVAFAELLALDAPLRPKAMISTSNALSPALATALRERLGATVIDWYSSVETGPVAVGCGFAHHLLSGDVHVELLDAAGRPAGRGEITVSGGRNPYLPLVRYRTGDHAAWGEGPCRCGDPAPRLVDLVGRTPVVFRAADGTPVGPVDVSRRLRELPVALHRLHQGRDGALRLDARPLPDHALHEADLRAALGELFGDRPVTVRVDPALGDEDPKLPAWRSELS